MRKHTYAIIILIVVVLIASIIVIRNGVQEPPVIGGDRDENGCLTSAGYSWNETLQVCLREWEVTGNDRQVLEYAMNYTRKENALTILNITKTNDCDGCFVVWFDTLGKLKSVDIFGEFRIYCSEEQRGPGIYCIQEYNPVCGSDEETYSNSCVACLNNSVEYYTEGECQ